MQLCSACCELIFLCRIQDLRQQLSQHVHQKHTFNGLRVACNSYLPYTDELVMETWMHMHTVVASFPPAKNTIA